MQLRGQSRRMHAHQGHPTRTLRFETECACGADVHETYSRQDRRSSGGLYHLVTTYCVSSSCTAIGYLPRRANQERKLQESLLHRTNGKNHYCIASTGGDLGSHGGAQARGAHTGGSSCARVRKCGYGGHSRAYETRAKPKSQIITSQFSFTSCMQRSVGAWPWPRPAWERHADGCSAVQLNVQRIAWSGQNHGEVIATCARATRKRRRHSPGCLA